MATIDERLAKLERIIYGDGTTDGLLVLVHDLLTTNKQLTQNMKEMRREMQELEKRMDKLNNFIIKIAVATSVASYIAGFITSSILHL